MFKKFMLVIAILFIQIHSEPSFSHTYNGSPDYKAPKILKCLSSPKFPSGMNLSLHEEEVYGRSFDRYVFSNLGGVMGIYYFDMEFPAQDNIIKGTVTYIDTKNWVATHYPSTCEVSEWYK